MVSHHRLDVITDSLILFILLTTVDTMQKSAGVNDAAIQLTINTDRRKNAQSVSKVWRLHLLSIHSKVAV